MLWKSGTATPTELGTLGNHASTSLAYGVDDANGQVVGWSYLSGGTTFTAFVWSSGTGMVNLNTSGLVTNLATSGFSYLNAGVCVNDSGQIAGFGTYPSQSGSGAGGVYKAFLLTPAISGDANLDGRVDINDLTIVLAHYGQSGEWVQGEFTGSGTVDINDLTIVLAPTARAELWLAGRRVGRRARAGQFGFVVGRDGGVVVVVVQAAARLNSFLGVLTTVSLLFQESVR